MLTRSANAISFDSGDLCVELRRMPDGRWRIATGVSVRTTGKSPWSPFTRDTVATADAAIADFLALLPDDPALHDRVTREFRELCSRFEAHGSGNHAKP